MNPDEHFFNEYDGHFRQVHKEILRPDFDRKGLIPLLGKLGKDLSVSLTKDMGKYHPPFNIIKTTNLLHMYTRHVNGQPLLTPSKSLSPHEVEEHEECFYAVDF